MTSPSENFPQNKIPPKTNIALNPPRAGTTEHIKAFEDAE
jgi:hypothetical protein